MCLAGRPEFRVHPEMQTQRPGAKPHAASRRKVRRLGLLNEAKHAGVELAGRGFHPYRHGELHVIEAKNLQVRRMLRSGAVALISIALMVAHGLERAHESPGRPHPPGEGCPQSSELG